MSTTTNGTRSLREGFRDYADRNIAPIADELHRTQRTPSKLIRDLGARGYLGLAVPAEYGGGGGDAAVLGLLAGELGRACSSLRSLLTVHTMVAHAVARWGTREQKDRWLPELASGETIGAVAISEPGTGSDMASVTTSISSAGTGFRLDGRKRWITYGHVADVFLVVARSAAGPTAVLIERDTPGLRTELITGLIGIRASMTADVRFNDCRIPRDNLLGREGSGLSNVADSALDLGRYTVAWGCVGILEACLTACVGYAGNRAQFGVLIKEHQLVRRMISGIFADHRAATLLCLDAGRLRDQSGPGAVAATSLAKYFAATAAMRAAADAVQIHGANGCGAEYPVQRYFGDAKVMEVVGGSSQIHQVGLAEYAFQEFG